MKKSLASVGILCGTVMVSGFALSRFPSDKNTMATSTEVVASASTTASVSIENTCSLSADSSTDGNSEHSATLGAGTYTEGIGQTTLTISCNDANGWALYAIGAGLGTVKTDLVDSEDSTITISTGTATSGDSSNWAMKLQNGTGTNTDGSTGPIVSDFASYAAVPSTNTKVASLDRNSDTSGGSSIATTYAAYISLGQTPGTYNGYVKYTLTHPYTNVVCDEGYENVDGVCLAPFDAAFAKAGKTKTGDYYVMQDMTASICSSVATPTSITDTYSTQLLDSRDSKVYWVSKFSDGTCWMTQNLDLDLSSSVALTPEDSNVTANWSPAISTYATDDTTWDDSYNTDASYDPGDNYLVMRSGDTRNTIYKSLSACTAAGNSEEVCQHGHQGNLYRAYTAMVGSLTNVDQKGRSEDIDQSICPKGWRLPVLGNLSSSTSNSATIGSWQGLIGDNNTGYISTFSSNLIATLHIGQAPFYIVAAGSYYGNGNQAGSTGIYLRSGGLYEGPNADDTTGIQASVLAFIINNVIYPGTSHVASRGISVRCVASQ